MQSQMGSMCGAGCQEQVDARRNSVVVGLLLLGFFSPRLFIFMARVELIYQAAIALLLVIKLDFSR